MIKKIIAFIPYHICFWSGHFISRIPWPGEAEWFMNTGYGAWTYIFYNKFMCWSLSVNDWGGLDYWKDASEDGY